MTDPNQIAVVDVTDDPDASNAEQVTTAKERLDVLLTDTNGFLAVTLGGDGVTKTLVACDDATFEPLTLAVVTMLGYVVLGDRSEGMPPEMVQHIAMATGMNRLNTLVQEIALGAAQAPRTPAGDADQADPVTH